MKKFLIIQTAFLGDVILTTPLVRTIKNIIHDAQIDFLCIPKTSEALVNNPLINEVIIWNKHRKSLFEYSRLLQKIHEKNYDIVLCPHRSVRSAVITQYSDAEQRIGFDINAFSGCLTGVVEYDSHKHEIYRNISLLKAAEGIELHDEKISSRPELYPIEEDLKYVNELLNESKNSTLAGFAPCSQWFTKQLPLEKSIDIVRKLREKNMNVFLFGSENDIEYCNKLKNSVINNGIIDLCGKLSVVQSYTAMAMCKIIITVDSAATHIASATDVPIITIFGSTIPSFGFSPISKGSITIGVENLECRPCTDHGRKKCPLEHFKCMYDINIGEISNYLEVLN